MAASLRMHLDVDVREALAEIRVPTLIIHPTDDMLVPVTCPRYMANWIPNARYLELAGSDHMYWLGDQDETHRARLSELGVSRRAEVAAEASRRL